MTLTAAIQEAYANAPPDVVIIDTIEIYHTSWASPIRLVRDRIPLTATLEATAPNNPGASVVFAASDFALGLPRIGDGRQELQLSIDNVSASMMPMLEAADLAHPTPVRAIYRPYLSTDLSGPHMNPPINLVLKSISASAERIVAKCGYAEFGNYRFPRYVYTVEEFPGIATNV